MATLALFCTAIGAMSSPMPAVNLSAPAAAPFGPDVSHYQGAINWPSVKSAGVGFAIAKATEGGSYVDPQFKANWDGMKSAGVPVRGAYHFGHPNTDAVSQVSLSLSLPPPLPFSLSNKAAVAQANHFVATVGHLAAGEFAVLDIEAANGEPATSVAKWCNVFVSTVQSKLGLPASRVPAPVNLYCLPFAPLCVCLSLCAYLSLFLCRVVSLSVSLCCTYVLWSRYSSTQERGSGIHRSRSLSLSLSLALSLSNSRPQQLLECRAVPRTLASWDPS